MSEPESEKMRVGDRERESALHALGEHMSVGRLDVDEYGDRSARVATARTVGELRTLFTDLPQPHPRFGAQPQAAQPAVVASATAAPIPASPATPLSQRVAAAAMPLACIAGIVLFFATGSWLWFLLPAAIGILGGAVWGDDWHAARRGHRHHRRRC